MFVQDDLRDRSPPRRRDRSSDARRIDRSRSRSRSRDGSSGPGQPNQEIMLEDLASHVTEDDVRPL